MGEIGVLWAKGKYMQNMTMLYRSIMDSKSASFKKPQQYLHMFWAFFDADSCSSCASPENRYCLSEKKKGKCFGACVSKDVAIALLSAMASFYTKSNSVGRRIKKRNAHKVHKSIENASMGAPCFCCNGESHHRHHIIQLQHGGINSSSNQVMLCRKCHSEVHKNCDAVMSAARYENSILVVTK